MKQFISRVFARKERRPGSAALPSGISSELSHSDIEAYYLRVIMDCLRRLLVPDNAVDVEVRRAGVGPGGLPVFAGYVKILRWDAVVTPVLLQNMPVLDARVRQVVAASVILEHTHFAGLWFQATARTEGAPKTLLGLPAELVHQPRGTAAGSS